VTVEPPHVALIGMMGAGKSVVARALALRLHTRAVDLDDEVVRDTGRSIPNLFAERGDAGFRDAETAALREVLGHDEPVVLATGGGVVLRADNVAVLRSRAVVVWLDSDVTTLAQRVGDGTGRPLLAGDPVGRLRVLDAERRPHYAAAAHLVVRVDGIDITRVADNIQQLLTQHRDIEVSA
jgi:shikimate kinase